MMVFSKILAGGAALAALIPASLALDPSLKTNVAVYYVSLLHTALV